MNTETQNTNKQGLNFAAYRQAYSENGECRPRIVLFTPFKNKFQQSNFQQSNKFQLVYITWMMDVNLT